MDLKLGSCHLWKDSFFWSDYHSRDVVERDYRAFCSTHREHHEYFCRNTDHRSLYSSDSSKASTTTSSPLSRDLSNHQRQYLESTLALLVKIWTWMKKGRGWMKLTFVLIFTSFYVLDEWRWSTTTSFEPRLSVNGLTNKLKSVHKVLSAQDTARSSLYAMVFALYPRSLAGLHVRVRG